MKSQILKISEPFWAICKVGTVYGTNIVLYQFTSAIDMDECLSKETSSASATSSDTFKVLTMSHSYDEFYQVIGFEKREAARQEIFEYDEEDEYNAEEEEYDELVRKPSLGDY